MLFRSVKKPKEQSSNKQYAQPPHQYGTQKLSQKVSPNESSQGAQPPTPKSIKNQQPPPNPTTQQQSVPKPPHQQTETKPFERRPAYQQPAPQKPIPSQAGSGKSNSYSNAPQRLTVEDLKKVNIPDVKLEGKPYPSKQNPLPQPHDVRPPITTHTSTTLSSAGMQIMGQSTKSGVRKAAPVAKAESKKSITGTKQSYGKPSNQISKKR